MLLASGALGVFLSWVWLFRWFFPGWWPVWEPLFLAVVVSPMIDAAGWLGCSDPVYGQRGRVGVDGAAIYCFCATLVCFQVLNQIKQLHLTNTTIFERLFMESSNGFGLE